MMADPMLRSFLEREIADEIIPTLDLPRSELDAFAASVIERFQNPFIRHELITITLNSTSKWRARVLPSVTEHVKRNGTLPKLLTFSFADYAEFFRCGTFDCKDDREVLDFFAAHRADSAETLMAALCAGKGAGMKKAIQIHDSDNVAVALVPLDAGESILGVTLLEPIPAGHKFALSSIAQGAPVIKYGLPIGSAGQDIAPGAWVHTHNVKTGLNENACYA
jgi:hypothetical protein